MRRCILIIFVLFFSVSAFSQTVPPPNIDGIITDVNPSSDTIPQNLLVNISGSGTHFSQGTGTAVWFSQGSSTIYASNVNELNNELLNAQMLFKYNHQPGYYTVNTYNEVDGLLSLGNGFYLNPNPNPPYLVSLSPASGQAGTMLLATITGQFTHFTQGYTYAYLLKSGGGPSIYSEEITITSDQVMNVEFSLTTGFDAGYYNLYVFNSWDGGLELNNVFYLNPDPDPPYLIDLNPDNGTIPETLTVTLSGVNTHFNQGTGTSLWLKQGSYTTIYPNDITPLSDTQINATFSFSNTDDPGLYDVKTVNGIDGTLLLEDAFLLNPNPNPPHLVSIDPGNAQPGSSLSVFISGANTNFTQGTGTTVWFTKGSYNIYANSVVEVNDELLDAYFYISNAANLGYYDVNTYDIEDGILSLTEAFYVSNSNPLLTQIVPDHGYLEDVINIHVFGDETHFSDASNLSAWLSFNGQNLYPGNLSSISNTEFAMDIAIPEDAQAGYWTMNVANSIDGLLSFPDAFEVIDTISGTHLTDKVLFINVYPNPTSGKVNISAKLLKSANFELCVCDIMGAQLAEFNFGDLVIYRGQVDLSFLPSGIYTLQFLIDNNIEIRKMVIQ